MAPTALGMAVSRSSPIGEGLIGEMIGLEADHFGRYDDRRGVSHAGLKASLGKRRRWRNFSEYSVWRKRNRRAEPHGRDRRRGPPLIPSRASKLASLLAAFAVELHRGQRTYPRRPDIGPQAGEPLRTKEHYLPIAAVPYDSIEPDSPVILGPCNEWRGGAFWL